MAKPNRVNIMGTEFTVKYAKLSGGDMGETKGNARIITIDPKLRGEELKSTTIHEIIHAILHVTGQAEILASYGEHVEESLVVALEHGLTPMIELKLDN